MKSGETLRGIAQQTRNKATIRSERASVGVTDISHELSIEAENLRRSQSLHNPARDNTRTGQQKETNSTTPVESSPKRKSWKGSPLRLFGRSKTKSIKATYNE